MMKNKKLALSIQSILLSRNFKRNQNFGGLKSSWKDNITLEKQYYIRRIRCICSLLNGFPLMFTPIADFHEYDDEPLGCKTRGVSWPIE
jgi:hypothetical protein